MPDNILDRAVNSVIPESLPGPEDNDTNHATNTPGPGPAPGDQGGTGDEGEQSGRTVDNVHGELTRKMQQEREYFTGRITSLEGKIDQLLTSNVSKPAAGAATPNTLDDMSIADLKRARAQVPDEQRAAFDEYLDDRRIQDAVDSKVRTANNRQSFVSDESTANTAAMSRWPDLRDPTSTIYAKTNQILQSMGDRAESNPRAVLEASNEAGLQLGLAPRGVVETRVPGVRHTGPGSGTTPAPSTDPAVSDTRIAEVAQGLAHAFTNGKISDEAMARIKENTALYKANIDKFTR